MRFIYWLSWILAALATWLTLGWFGLQFIAVDPYYDRQVDAVISSAPSGFPSKGDIAVIEKGRSNAFQALGLVGGVLCGFAFGVAGCRFAHAREGRQRQTLRAPQ